MNNSKIRLLAFAALALTASSLFAADVPVLPLWPDGIPNKVAGSDFEPTLTVYLPEEAKNTHAAVVICPGGGYSRTAMDHEGHDIAKWFNSFGVAGIILDYRLGGRGYKHPAPLQDAQRAIRTVRTKAKEWKIDPAKIGVMGFSAGGHLASSAGTHFVDGDPDAKDPIGRVSSRPDFMILCYPVIAFDEPYTHYGSQRNLLGKDADPALVKKMSSEKQVTPQTPPTFLWHTQEDKGVPIDNSIQFYRALTAAGVPGELHIYQKGRHGLGLATGKRDTPGTNTWSKACETWLKTAGFVE